MAENERRNGEAKMEEVEWRTENDDYVETKWRKMNVKWRTHKMIMRN